MKFWNQKENAEILEPISRILKALPLKRSVSRVPQTPVNELCLLQRSCHDVASNAQDKVGILAPCQGLGSRIPCRRAWGHVSALLPSDDGPGACVPVSSLQDMDDAALLPSS